MENIIPFIWTLIAGVSILKFLGIFIFFFILTFSSAQVRTVRPEANENVVVGHDK